MSLALSIIIPVYNCEKTIRKCLDSIFIQKNDLKYEIIIVDDGSSDGTVEVEMCIRDSCDAQKR